MNTVAGGVPSLKSTYAEQTCQLLIWLENLSSVQLIPATVSNRQVKILGGVLVSRVGLL